GSIRWSPRGSSRSPRAATPTSRSWCSREAGRHAPPLRSVASTSSVHAARDCSYREQSMGRGTEGELVTFTERQLEINGIDTAVLTAGPDRPDVSPVVFLHG